MKKATKKVTKKATWEFFQKVMILYLSPNRHSLSSCYQFVAEHYGYTSMPSLSTISRMLKKIDQSMVAVARDYNPASEPAKVTKAMLNDYVDRKLEDVTVGELLSFLDTAAPAKSCNSQPLKNLKDKLDKFLGEKR